MNDSERLKAAQRRRALESAALLGGSAAVFAFASALFSTLGLPAFALASGVCCAGAAMVAVGLAIWTTQ